MARLGGMALGQAGSAAGHVSALAAIRVEARTRRAGELATDLQRLPGSGAHAKKKTLIAAEQDRPDVAHKRGEWQSTQPQIDPGRVVFLDETWAKTNMTRRYG